jgi:dTDP-4-dehydrorhamnose 3,5-epimerase
MIQGVEIKQLRSHRDDRGFFREVLRSTDPIFTAGAFGQWSHSLMTRNVVKAWHFHHRQTDWWYLPVGLIETVLVDFREESPTYKEQMIIPMGDSASYPHAQEVLVRIPPGVLHGCRVFSEFAHLFYVTSHTYNPDDEGRIPFDSSLVGYNWGDDVITSEKDRVLFTPPFPRER